ncbi:MAG TPA: hypothetical protein VE196_07185 [Pseudonocardiaceae bacterium]|nr:hypothetical protein [Pseudonocardiaceae bacterium]
MVSRDDQRLQRSVARTHQRHRRARHRRIPGLRPLPDLDQFKAYLASGQIRYLVAGPIFDRRFGGGLPGSFPGGDGGDLDRGRPGEFVKGTGTQISQWVKENFTPITIDGQTIYNLSQPKL